MRWRSPGVLNMAVDRTLVVSRREVGGSQGCACPGAAVALLTKLLHYFRSLSGHAGLDESAFSSACESPSASSTSSSTADALMPDTQWI